MAEFKLINDNTEKHAPENVKQQKLILRLLEGSGRKVPIIYPSTQIKFNKTYPALADKVKM